MLLFTNYSQDVIASTSLNCDFNLDLKIDYRDVNILEEHLIKIRS